jgi:CPA2 family monovalent cation:H+ antiporter-2
MLLKPSAVIAAPLELVTVVLVIIVAKPVITGLVLHVLHQPPSTVATIAAGLGQIGEFSFILAALGRTLGLLPDLGYQLIISGSIISIALNPLLFKISHAVMARRHPEAVADLAPSQPTPSVAPASGTEPEERVLP